jgi:hypothetical protein
MVLGAVPLAGQFVIGHTHAQLHVACDPCASTHTLCISLAGY